MSDDLVARGRHWAEFFTGDDYEGLSASDDIAALADEVERLSALVAKFDMEETRHFVFLTDDTWSIQHPAGCNPIPAKGHQRLWKWAS